MVPDNQGKKDGAQSQGPRADDVPRASAATPTNTQSPRKGFLGLVDAFREGMREADEKEAQEKAKDAENLVEDISWFQKSLGELLEPGEAVCFQLEGLDISGLVCTDRRVIIFHTGHFTWMLGNVRSFHATYDQIISVSLIEERIRIQPLLGGGYVFEVVTPEMQAGATVSGSMFEFAAEPNRIAFAKDKAAKLEKVVAFVRGKSESVPPDTSQAASAASEDVASPVAMLEKLAELKAKGILTDEEFSAQKDKLLKRM